MLDETEFAVPVDPSLEGPSSTAGPTKSGVGDGASLRQLASAVLRLWGETFKGVHIFEMVNVMGASLDAYADLVDKAREGTPAPPMVGVEEGGSSIG